MAPDLPVLQQNFQREIDAFLSDPSVPKYGKSIFEIFLTYDCVDAANLADIISGLLAKRAEAIISANTVQNMI